MGASAAEASTGRLWGRTSHSPQPHDSLGSNAAPSLFVKCWLHLLEDEDGTARPTVLVGMMMGELQLPSQCAAGAAGAGGAVSAMDAMGAVDARGAGGAGDAMGAEPSRQQAAAEPCLALAKAPHSQFLQPHMDLGWGGSHKGCSPSPSASPECSHPSSQSMGIFHLSHALGTALLTCAGCFRKPIPSCHECCLWFI